MDLDNSLLDGNKKWVRERLKRDPEYFQNLAKGQSPQFLFIGCSDSRVPANEITRTKPGDIFVHRNIANMVVHSDTGLIKDLGVVYDSSGKIPAIYRIKQKMEVLKKQTPV